MKKALVELGETNSYAKELTYEILISLEDYIDPIMKKLIEAMENETVILERCPEDCPYRKECIDKVSRMSDAEFARWWRTVSTLPCARYTFWKIEFKSRERQRVAED